MRVKTSETSSSCQDVSHVSQSECIWGSNIHLGNEVHVHVLRSESLFDVGELNWITVAFGVLDEDSLGVGKKIL
jgi:hypothetical protein